MHVPKHCAENRLHVQHELIERHPLGLIICTDTKGRLSANHVPFTLVRKLDENHSGDSPELGQLRAHIARPNPHWRALEAADECLVVFQGPDAYISPNWYPPKPNTAKSFQPGTTSAFRCVENR